MTGARTRTLLLLALAVGVASWTLLDLWERSGSGPVPLPWTAPVAVAVTAGVVLGASREVRRWVAGQRPRPLDPLVAARIAVLATAAAYVGAVLVGWYLAQAAVLLPNLVGDRRGRFWLAVVSAVLGAGLSVAGMVGQRWCRRPPDKDEGSPSGPAGSRPAAPRD